MKGQGSIGVNGTLVIGVGVGPLGLMGIVGQGWVDGVAAGVEGTEQDPGCAVPRSA